MNEVANISKQVDLLARYLPDGRAWEAKWIEGSNLRNLLKGLGQEFSNIEDRNEWLRRELNIFTTYDLLPYWEDHYGIPDDNGVFTTENKSIEDRRLNLYIKEKMEGADRIENWEEIAKLFGFKCKVYPAIDVSRFPLKFPILFTSKPRYTIVVDLYDVNPPAEFNLVFPVIFGENKASFIKKVFNIIKPSDCTIMYNYIK
jgi:uncharacterized protein YmfQ (DUF2313 family)